MDEKTEQFKKTFFALNSRYPTKAEIDKSMQKFLSEEDELLLNSQPEQSVVIDIEDSQSSIIETNLDEVVLNINENTSDNDDQDVGGESDHVVFDNTPTVIEKTV